MAERHRTGEQARRQLEASYTGYAGEDDERTSGRPGQLPARVERPAGIRVYDCQDRGHHWHVTRWQRPDERKR